MHAKTIHKLWRLLLLPLLLLAATGCEEEEEAYVQQQQRMVSYLTSTHTPRLVAENELEEESQLPFYEALGNGIYRYLPGYYNPDRTNWPVVTAASRVTLTFRFYAFNFANITDSTVPFYTNDPRYERALYEQLGLTPGVWIFEPVTLDLANDRILKGLRRALIGCREGDEVEAYMTYNEAYGSDYFSILPQESPVAMFLTISNVE